MTILGLEEMADDVSFKAAVTEAVGLTAGVASVCWEPTPEGVFQSDRVKAAVNEAVDFIIARAETWLMDNPRIWRDKSLDYATRNNVAGNADSALRDAAQYEDYILNGRKENSSE